MINLQSDCLDGFVNNTRELRCQNMTDNEYPDLTDLTDPLSQTVTPIRIQFFFHIGSDPDFLIILFSSDPVVLYEIEFRSGLQNAVTLKPIHNS